MNARHSSETNEHYTPSYIVEAARVTLGTIDLDPASCEVANRTVRASKIFTKEVNGLMKSWSGNVFLNPPGGFVDDKCQTVIKASKGSAACSETGACGLPAPHTHTGTVSSQKLWWQKLANEFEQGDVQNGIFVCFSVELLQTTQVGARGAGASAGVGGYLPLEFPICYPRTRVAYVKADGTVGGSPPHSSCIICVTGDDTVEQRFREAFGSIGRVVVPS